MADSTGGAGSQIQTTVRTLYEYPIKSCRGIEVKRAELDAYGSTGDRRWMLIDDHGKFLSQRSWPRMALIDVQVNGAQLRVKAPAMEDLLIAGSGNGPPRAAEVWQDQVSVRDAGDEAAEWFSRFLGSGCRLVGMGVEYRRPVRKKQNGPDVQTNLSDGFPFLLISEASLQALNSRLQAPLPMNRFRPNIVVSGCEAFAEDQWQRIRIGDIRLDVVKPCARCSITATDQDSGQRDGTEPLRTLATFRRLDATSAVYFGQNLVHRQQSGSLAVGDPVEVLKTRV